MLSSSFSDSANSVRYRSSSLREAGFLLRNALKNRFTCIQITYNCSSAGFPCTACDVLREALRHTGLPDEGDYLDVCIRRCICHTLPLSEREALLRFFPVYRTTRRQEQQVSVLCRQLRSDLLSLPAPDERLYTIHKLLTRHCRYHRDPDEFSYTAFGALLREEAVCQGLAAGFYRLALECGLDCRIIYGSLKDCPHAWNLVRLGSWYYHTDITNEREGLRLHACLPDYRMEPTYCAEDFIRLYPPVPKDHR